MSKSKVYFSDFHTIALGDGIPKSNGAHASSRQKRSVSAAGNMT